MLRLLSPAHLLCKLHLDSAALAALLISGVTLVGGHDRAMAQTIDTNLWVTDGTVNAVAADGGTIYIGGNFHLVGPATGCAVPLDATTGQPIALPRVDGSVSAVAPDGTGGWYVGGSFTHVGGVPRTRLAHILADGTVSSWNPNAGGGSNPAVFALAVSGNTVYAGGGFTIIAGQARNHIAALDASTGLATAWDPNAGGIQVLTLAVSGTTIYAGGNFYNIGGQDRNHIAALDASTGLATPWNPNANQQVDELAVSGTTIYAGGDFTSIGGQPRNHIAALDASTGLATPWNPDANSPVHALAVSGTTIYAGGDFDNVGGQNRYGVAALDASTGLATAWNPSGMYVGPQVYALAVSGSTIYVGGYFFNLNGHTRNNIAAVRASNGNLTNWDPSANSGVSALAVSGNTVFAGGSFTSVGGQGRDNIAALDASSGIATNWNPAAGGEVFALAVSGSTVYVGGSFRGIGGQARNSIAALNTSTGSATAWNPNATIPGSDAVVSALAVSGSTVYVGGYFAAIGVQTRNNIAAVDASSGLATAWNPNAGGATPTRVFSLAVSGNTVYAGGAFKSIGGQPRSCIAALDAASGLATAWNPDSPGGINALAVSGNTVYVGGYFATIGGQPRSRIAALDASSGLATPWNPNANTGTVYALWVSESTVYAGGSFTAIGGQLRNKIASLDVVSGLATPWDPNVGGSSSEVHALAVSGSTVYAGGSFSKIGIEPQYNIAAISADATTVSVGDDIGAITRSALELVGPNPTMGGLQIQYTIVRPGPVRLEVIDVAGRVVATLADRVQSPGRYVTTWDGRDGNRRVPSGIYLLRLTAPDHTTVRKFVTIR
jgi:hypothetical protein